MISEPSSHVFEADLVLAPPGLPRVGVVARSDKRWDALDLASGILAGLATVVHALQQGELRRDAVELSVHEIESAAVACCAVAGLMQGTRLVLRVFGADVGATIEGVAASTPGDVGGLTRALAELERTLTGWHLGDLGDLDGDLRVGRPILGGGLRWSGCRSAEGRRPRLGIAVELTRSYPLDVCARHPGSPLESGGGPRGS